MNSSGETLSECEPLDGSGVSSDESASSGPSSFTRGQHGRPSDHSSASESSRRHYRQQKRRRYAMDSRPRRRKYKNSVNNNKARADTCVHNLERVVCHDCVHNRVCSERQGATYGKQPAEGEGSGRGLMTVYNVTRRSVELFSPPGGVQSTSPDNNNESNPAAEPAQNERERRARGSNEWNAVESGSDAQEMKRRQNHSGSHTRDYRQLVGSTNDALHEKPRDCVVKLRKMDDDFTQLRKDNARFGSTYVISKEVEAPRKIVKPRKRIQTQLITEWKTVGQETTQGDAAEISPQEPRVSSTEERASARVEPYLGALCDQTVVQKQGHWAPGGRSFNIAMSDAGSCSDRGAISDSTLTELDADWSSSGESGNEADVSEWDENLLVGDIGDPNTFRKLLNASLGTPKRSEAPLDISSPKAQRITSQCTGAESPVITEKNTSSRSSQNSQTNFLQNFQSTTPKNKVHLDVKGFLSLPSSPSAALLRDSRRLTPGPSPSHLKQIFDKLKASVNNMDTEQIGGNNESSLNRTPSSSTRCQHKPEVFKTPSTVPKAKMRKRLDLNYNEDVIITLDSDGDENQYENDNDDTEKGKNTRVNKVELAKSDQELSCERHGSNNIVRSKNMHSPAPPVHRKKFQSFDELFKEMGRSSGHKNPPLECSGQVSSVLVKNQAKSPRNVKQTEREISETFGRTKVAQSQDKITVVDPESDLGRLDSRKSSVVKTPIRGQGQNKGQGLSALSSPPKLSRVTSTPCKVNSPMPSVLDISVIHNPDAAGNDGKRKRVETMAQRSRGPTDSSDPIKVQKSYTSPETWISSVINDKEERSKSSGTNRKSNPSSDFCNRQLCNGLASDNRLGHGKAIEESSSPKTPQRRKGSDRRRVLDDWDMSPRVGKSREQHMASPSTPKEAREPKDTQTPKSTGSRERRKSAHTPKGQCDEVLRPLSGLLHVQ